MKCMFIIAFLVSFFIGTFAQSNIDWTSQVIYFVLLDRFHNGDTQNDWKPEPSDAEHPYHPLYTYRGGDIAGLIEKLPYLQELGVTTIWLSPLFDNNSQRFFDYWAYHGYWIKDFARVEERFTDIAIAEKSQSPKDNLTQTEKLYGDVATVKKLREELHKRGMYLILDMVVNHVDYNCPLVKAKPDWFHKEPDLQGAAWNNPLQVLNGKVHGLPDLAHENPEVEKYLIDIAKLWIREIQPDGFRLDAVKHVPVEFWSKYNESIRQDKLTGDSFFLLGEFYEGYAKDCVKMLNKGKFSSLFDFPLYYKMVDIIAKNETAEKFGDLFSFDSFYSNPNLLATFLENHDLERFFTTAQEDVSKFKSALALLFSVRGIPTLYYGTEIGMKGRCEKVNVKEHENGINTVVEIEIPPENRQDMNFSPDKLGQEIFAYTKKLINIRQNSLALTKGTQLHLSQNRTMYAFARLHEKEIAIVVYNKDTKPCQAKIPLAFLLTYMVDGELLDKTQNIPAIIENEHLISIIPPQTCAIFLTPAQKIIHIVTGEAYTVCEEYQKWKSSPELIPVTFRLKVYHAESTEEAAIIGESNLVGDWNPSYAKGPMEVEKVEPIAHGTKTFFDITYKLTLMLPQGYPITYKHILNYKSDKRKWELCMTNRYLQVPWTGEIEVLNIWDKE